jgi:hypothetical protein
MLNMSFYMTYNQMLQEIKWITRRIGWWNLKQGDLVMAVKKGMGLKAGEKIERLYPIQILSVRQEPLSAITPEDVVAEGFPDWTTEMFIEFFIQGHKNCERDTIVNRIHFRKALNLPGV